MAAMAFRAPILSISGLSFLQIFFMAQSRNSGRYFFMMSGRVKNLKKKRMADATNIEMTLIVAEMVRVPVSKKGFICTRIMTRRTTIYPMKLRK